MVRRSLLKKAATFVTAAALLMGILCSPVGVSAAAQDFIPDDSYEELYVDTSLLDDIYSQPYAKFSSTVAGIDDYYLLLSSDEQEEKFAAALDKSKVIYDEDYITAFVATLIKYDENGDEKSTVKALSLYLPLPDDAQEDPEGCMFFEVKSNKASQTSSKLYKDDYDTYYIKLDLTDSSDYSTLYGFVYSNPYDSDDEDEDDYYDDSDDEPDDEELEKLNEPLGNQNDTTDEPKESGAPLELPEDSEEDSTEIEDDPLDKYDLPEDESQADDEDDEVADESIPASTPVPTTAPVSTPAPTSTPKPTSVPKDTIPKTGDDFPYGILGLAGAGSAGILVFAVILKRKRM